VSPWFAKGREEVEGKVGKQGTRPKRRNKHISRKTKVAGQRLSGEGEGLAGMGIQLKQGVQS